MEINNNPKRIQIQPTNRCNLTCRFCWISSSDRNKPRIELSKNKWDAIIEEIVKFDPDRLIVCGGGEPLVRKEVSRNTVKKLNGKEIYSSLVTNGTLFDEKLIREMMENKWDHVVFSLHAPFARESDFLKGKKGTFKTTLENIQKIKHFKSKFDSKKPTLAATSVITEHNFQLLTELAELAKELDLKPLALRLLQNPDEKCRFLKKENIPQLKNKVEDMREKGTIELEFKLEELVNYYEETKQEIRGNKESQAFCYSPFFEMTIFADGTVAPCCYMDNNDYMGTTSISDKSLEEIWFGEGLGNFRERMLNGNPPDVCNNCSVSPEEMKDLESLFNEIMD